MSNNLAGGGSLHGQFITLRPIRVSDAEQTLSWRISQRAALLNRGAETVEAQAVWIASRPATEYNFVIETKAGTSVGMLSLIAVDRINLHAETARFLIGDEAAVKGIPAAVEAMKLLYELAFDTLGLRRIYGTIGSKNGLMIKWQKYLGMKEEGRLRRHYFLNGEFQDAVCMGLLESEYRTESIPRMKSLIALGASGKAAHD